MAQTGSPEEQARTENVLVGSLKSLLAVSEAYPDLKANTGFIDLQHQLVDDRGPHPGGAALLQQQRPRLQPARAVGADQPRRRAVPLRGPRVLRGGRSGGVDRATGGVRSALTSVPKAAQPPGGAARTTTPGCRRRPAGGLPTRGHRNYGFVFPRRTARGDPGARRGPMTTGPAARR